MKNKILTSSPFFLYSEFKDKWNPLFDPLGGMHIVSRALVIGLAGRGFQQEVLTMAPPDVPRDYRIDDRVQVHARRLPVLPIRSGLEGYVGLVLAWGTATVIWILANLHRLRREVALVHAHCDGSGSAPAVGYLAARLLGVPLVGQIHSSRFSGQTVSAVLETLVWPISTLIERRMLRSCDRVLVLSQRSKLAIAKNADVNTDRIVTLPVSTTDDFSSQSSKDMRRVVMETFHLDENIPWVMYLGRISIEKGVDLFVQAAAQLLDRTPFHFVVVGDGPERTKIEKLAIKLGMGQRIKFTGFVEPRLVPAIIASARVGVVPSRYEEFGLVVTEFMKVGVPVVAFRLGGLSDLIKDEETGLLVEPGDAHGLAGAIERVITDRALTARLVTGAQSIPDRYSLLKSIDRLVAIYAELGVTTK